MPFKNQFPFEVITEATQPTFPVDDRCSHCREFDKDGCYNCGPLTIAKVFNPAEPPIPIDDLRKAFEALDAAPLKIGGNHPPNTASFVDDNPENPVQLCDAQGNQLVLMSHADYQEIMKFKSEVSMGCAVRDVTPIPAGGHCSYEALLQASYDLGPTTGPQATRLLTPSFVPKDPKDG